MTTYFFPSRNIKTGQIRFDGAGPLTEFYDFTMAEILNQPSSYFFFSDDVNPVNISATFLKTVFVFEYQTTVDKTYDQQRNQLDHLLRRCVYKMEEWNTKQQTITLNTDQPNAKGTPGAFLCSNYSKLLNTEASSPQKPFQKLNVFIFHIIYLSFFFHLLTCLTC